MKNRRCPKCKKKGVTFRQSWYECKYCKTRFNKDKFKEELLNYIHNKFERTRDAVTFREELEENGRWLYEK